MAEAKSVGEISDLFGKSKWVWCGIPEWVVVWGWFFKEESVKADVTVFRLLKASRSIFMVFMVEGHTGC